MATDGVNITEDAEMAECDGDKVVTMMDVLQEQQDFEEDANAVLGASDDKNCTYTKGYIKRQALYACLTCCSEAKTDPMKRAGVCLACSLNCHENHELVELYTKRNFRCDCGNPNFNSHPCQFISSKPDLNDENVYNQNFSGLYCTCQRPYPDPESTFMDDMIQCVICEDWLHASHLEAVIPANDQYSEMICKGCMNKNDFLYDYSNFAVNVESVDVDIISVSSGKPADALCNGELAKEVLMNGKIENNPTEAVITNGDRISQDSEHNDKNIAASDDSYPIEEEAHTSHKGSEDSSNTKMELDAVRQIEKELSEAKDITQDDKECNETVSQNEKVKRSEEKHDEESPRESEEIPEPDQLNETANDKSNRTDDTLKQSLSETQEQDSEHSTNIDKGDGDNADIKAEGDADANRIEDQLLDDIRALTAENPSVDATTTLISEKAAEETPGASSDEVSNETIEGIKIEEASTIKTTSSEIPETKPVSEKNDIDVPDTSQKDSDDKTDSVMDAIDELLKGPIETKDNESMELTKIPSEEFATNRENSNTTENPNDIEMSSDKELETAETSNTDIEMTDNKNQDESAAKQSAIKTENILDDEKRETDNVERIDSTSEPQEDENKSNSDVAIKYISTDIDEIVNGDISQNKVKNETKDSIESDVDSTSKSEPSLDENKVSETESVKRKLSVESAEENSPKKAKIDVEKCVRPKNVKRVFKGATFWPSNFRQKLCTCGECISMYKDLQVMFLIDPEDTVLAYESLGKENMDGGASQYEKGLQALSSLDRIQQINALTEYNKMRDKLLDFLKSFKDRKEIVKEEDIKAFFADMKPRREPDGVYFCR